MATKKLHRHLATLGAFLNALNFSDDVLFLRRRRIRTTAVLSGEQPTAVSHVDLQAMCQGEFAPGNDALIEGGGIILLSPPTKLIHQVSESSFTNPKPMH